jgi:hypothetical protein
MENLRENLLLLCQLQEKDNKIFELEQNIKNAPEIIEKKKNEIEKLHKDFEQKKAEYVRLNSLKKEKEALLSAKEANIAKHNADLITIKSNDLYKTCLLEIEKAKADKSVIEDEILQLMEDIDKEFVNVKKQEEESKKIEANIQQEIASINDTCKNAREKLDSIAKEREEFSKKIDSNLLSQYERIRENRNGQGLALIDGDSCGCCSMTLRPQLINQATKCSELVYCDNCSRILFNKKEIV